ncbi:hypothetical protein DXV75_13985 [Alteromonas aestuariivivens]|uniref:Uncharacterized protein n=1 Tax=Alteromonas aestuariivivens TaxID=1938339 RepID=A0A3D8M449_9ALTE|nr:hypothetical protein [Alteromonas aestuariivivens]RDV24527.1 hypothetical protein DXV75_13985 [Alteromonas aestuariivivens]
MKSTYFWRIRKFNGFSVCQRTEHRKAKQYIAISTNGNLAGSEKTEVLMQNPTKDTKPDQEKRAAPGNGPQKQQTQHDQKKEQQK